MALTHEIETQSGALATYFHVYRRDIYDTEGCVDIYVKGYLSEQSRIDGKENIYTFSKRYPLGGSELTKPDAYALIKTEPEFNGAIDDL